MSYESNREETRCIPSLDPFWVGVAETVSRVEEPNRVAPVEGEVGPQHDAVRSHHLGNSKSPPCGSA
jgi:hypothetical protein